MAEPVVAVRVRADVGIAGAGVLVDEDCGNTVEAIALQVRGEAEGTQRVILTVRVVGLDVPDSAGESQCRIQQQSGTEGMRVGNGEQVGVGPSRAALAGIGVVLEAVQARARGIILIRKLGAHQIVLGPAMVDFQVELVVRPLACTGAEPVVVDIPAGDICCGK